MTSRTGYDLDICSWNEKPTVCSSKGIAYYFHGWDSTSEPLEALCEVHAKQCQEPTWGVPKTSIRPISSYLAGEYFEEHKPQKTTPSWFDNLPEVEG